MTALPPLVEPGRELTRDELARYTRHLVLPGIGPEGQRRLANARVLVVGAGGLGSPALLYLAAAGVGTLGIVDDDVVEVSNLQRQVIHGVSDLGRAKTASARTAVAEVNPHVRVIEHRERLTAGSALDVLSGYDLVLDGTDSFATRYLVSDAAEVLGLPCVWGAIYRFTGQVATFWGAPRGAADGARGVTYRDVFPVPPPPGASPDCAEGGVLGAMCGTIGSVLATEAVKLITGAGETLLGRLALYDALALTWRQLVVRRDPGREPVTALLGAGAGTAGAGAAPDPYAVFCGLPGAEPGAAGRTTVSVRELATSRADGSPSLVLDVREPWEVELAALPDARMVASGTFASDGASRAVDDIASWAAGRTVHVLCKSGARSAKVAALLRDAGLDARSVEGGILAWARDVDESVPVY